MSTPAEKFLAPPKVFNTLPPRVTASVPPIAKEEVPAALGPILDASLEPAPSLDIRPTSIAAESRKDKPSEMSFIQKSPSPRDSINPFLPLSEAS